MASDTRGRDLDWLRRQFVIALALDDDLFELLVLKGGNALNLLHQVGLRASLDIDYSLEDDVDGLDEFGAKLENALKRHLESQGLLVLDWKFSPRPSTPSDGADPSWGGYEAVFKVIEAELFSELDDDLDKARRQAWGITSSGGAPRSFRFEFSKFEYCAGAKEYTVDGVAVRVYPLAMIAVEKLRSLCQQMKECGQRDNPASRARDFYDIHAVVTEGGVNLTSETNRELLRAVFKAKAVPLSLLGKLDEYREFHRGSWDAVEATIPADRNRDYDFYVDYVLRIIEQLEPLWVEDAP